MKLPRDIIARAREIITMDGGVRCNCCTYSVSHSASCSFRAPTQSGHGPSMAGATARGR